MDPYRTIGRFRVSEEAHAEVFERIADSIGTALHRAPLSAEVPALYANAKRAVVSHELVAWVIDTAADANATLAEAIFSEQARARLVERFIAAAAERMADDELRDMAAFAEHRDDEYTERAREARIFSMGGME